MANFFDAFRQEQFGDASGPGHGAVDFEADTIKVALIDTGTVDPAIATHQDHADISTAIVGTATALSSKTLNIATNVATFDAADTTISTVSGNTVEELLLYKDSGVSGTSLLIMQWDQGDVTGLQLTPNGGDVTITWNASGIWSV
jgi:hypothetical protein